ncbi:MAG TPA: hypothetical protein VK492_00335 [Chitinophagaceae bacterium]|nr:hypothetical protein [Chitinophagaceae bacterium]
MDNVSFHGTNESNALIIMGPPPNVDINIGKGELGKGFYTGSSLAIGAIWAELRYKEKGVVIEFDIPRNKFVQLRGYLIKTKIEVIDNWHTLKIEGIATTHEFGYDYIIAPFATIEPGYQFKFESKRAEKELNGASKNVYPCGY